MSSQELDSLQKSSSPTAVGAYERPSITPIGNLHDLLAFTEGSRADDPQEGCTPGSGEEAC